ncbi:hypothetical protein EJV47_07760 [Hymenobacter gummosus]|uniref:Uncharacterized protein n=1 Tax=Hymenobacter gummosus TaxID=1776032 RepID=A0A3S0H8J5_9BACT|nr:hypothetical protein [Hymenobacter gummosus]RTQ51682.1 hypothetical protein EJV47_07760 [Hymenobacter gummosus]
MNFDLVLRHIEQRLGPPPRRFNFWDRLTWLRLRKPDWDWRRDEIRSTVFNWERAFLYGKLTWAHLVQANYLMFQKVPDNCPGGVLIWREATRPFDPDALAEAAAQLYRLKGHSAKLRDPAEQAFAALLEDELTRPYGLAVPPRLAQGLDLRLSTVFFQRQHLPGGVLSGSLFPVLYLDEDPMVTVLVPERFWPADFRASW